MSRYGSCIYSEIYPDIKDDEIPEVKGGWERDKDSSGTL